MDVMSHLLKWSEASPGLPERVVMICWGLWKNRNEVRNGGQVRTGSAIVGSSLRLLDEFQEVNVKQIKTGAHRSEVVKWRPPQLGMYKVNTDGTVFTKHKSVGIGVVVRDSNGEVIAALCKRRAGQMGALETEALAMEAAVQFAVDVGLREVVFEGDSLSLCNMIQGSTEVQLSIQNIVDGIKSQLPHFRVAEVSHVKRQGNVPAHLLAQYAVHVEDYVAWLEECPSPIARACTQDVLSLVNDE